MQDQVILVDERDNQIGTGAKIAVHQSGELHRAFSIFVFDTQGRLLLQRRADHKYHSAGLWTNTCCSHPRPGESVEEAARRRLGEEMGMECGLEEIFAFIYNARLENGLIEHEYDHVLVGHCDAAPSPDPDEVGEWRWADLDELEQSIAANPAQYTVWFRLSLPRVLDWLRGHSFPLRAER